ncbi:hypothetical protein [uncultured Prochlorococcus sp.]|uniref:hypothetical protein n=1 Tax=uncultured Prochlorococcus sp. TaxID=159733 RepID=UPI002590A6A2|nr:hypothetical protein [uncultured Prochlorococcus sp.]
MPLKSENQTEKCPKSTLISFILNSIEEFDLAENYDLSCSQYEMIDLIPEDSLFISTKRSRGKDQICLTSSKTTGKCTHKIGFFIGKGNPSNKLCRMFKKNCSLNKKPLVLTETVERLYLKPSTLLR